MTHVDGSGTGVGAKPPEKSDAAISTANDCMKKYPL